jgi:uncharacterized membrane protein
MSTLTTIARGDGSHIVRPRRAIVRDTAEWAALWTAHAGPGIAAPAIDFGATIVAAAFAGERPTPGYEIDIVEAALDGSPRRLRVEEQSPAAGSLAAQVIVTPYHIVAVPRGSGDVSFERDEPARARSQSRAPALRIADFETPRSTTGLDPRIAASLAYLAGPFSAVVILSAERSNHYVKFHAWQSIFGLGAMAALAMGLLVLAFLMLFFSPVAFLILYWSAALMALACVVTLVTCIGNAFTGRAWKLPIAGDYAERRALRP